MKQWRIKSVTYEANQQMHILQTRMLGFLWWYNPDHISGIFTTYDKAVQGYDRKMFVETSIVTMLGDRK